MGKSEVIFLGGFLIGSVLKKFMADSRNRVGLSNHNFEKALLSGLCDAVSCGEISLDIVTLPKIYSYPHNNSHIYTPGERTVLDGVPVRSLPLLNLVVVNKIWGFFAVLFALLGAYRKTSGSRVSLIVNTSSWVMDSAVFLSRCLTSKKIVTTLIVPDLPKMINSMFSQKRTVKSRIVAILDRYGKWLASKYDSYVFLTEAMKKHFRKGAPYIVMEGLANPAWLNNQPAQEAPGKRHIILYTGTLARIFGIMELVSAFRIMGRDDAELHICGSGETAAELAGLAARNPDVIFHGMVPADKAIELQRNATVLVNPRNSSGEYTAYSFPSKTMEYLAAGKPVVMFRLPGIPAEYMRYLVTPSDETPEGLAAAISSVLDMTPERRAALGREGRKFIAEQKNAKVQVRRILGMIDKVEK